jgi:hypothetical protein
VTLIAFLCAEYLTLYTFTYRSLNNQNLIMIHGGIQPEQSTSTSEDVTGSRAGEKSSEAAVADDNTTAREEKTRVLERVEHEMDIFRKGDCSRFQASSRVAHELGNWVGASDKEKGKAFDSYLAEINSPAAVQDDERSLTRGTSLPAGSTLPAGQPPARKRIREEVEELLDQVSREGLEGDDNGNLQLGPGSARKRVREEDMPWFNSTLNSNRRSSCIETSRILLQFSEDLGGVKSLLRVANNLPEGIPSSQSRWDRILRGESIDLNQILSSMHFVQLDEERKGRLGGAEVVFTMAESKRQVKTGSEWSSAFRRMAKAVVFLFPHRREELYEYADYIEGLFSAKHANAHSKVILYDQSVRNRVGGGQNILLTDYQRFSNLSEAILHADGVEYKGGGGKGPPRGGNGPEKGESSKKDTCRRFNSQSGCRFTEEECYYKHICKGCGKVGHGKSTCTAEKQQ